MKHLGESSKSKRKWGIGNKRDEKKYKMIYFFLKGKDQPFLLRICLPMQGMHVQSLVWEDPTCHGATKPVYHSY